MRTSLWKERRGAISEDELVQLLKPHFNHELGVDYYFVTIDGKRCVEHELYCNTCVERIIQVAKPAIRALEQL